MDRKPWVVHEVTLTSDARRDLWNAHYKFHVMGVNLWSEDQRNFSWTVPDLAGPNWDLSEASMDEETRAAIDYYTGGAS